MFDGGAVDWGSVDAAMKEVISRWAFCRWMPCPLGQGGYVVSETDTHYVIRQSQNLAIPCMRSTVPKWAMREVPCEQD